jgi:sigma-B regulation protein RsbU (phosphoserine phosphatase)
MDYLLTAMVRRDHKGHIVVYQGLVRDITELDYGAGEVRMSGQHEAMIVVRRDGRVELVDTMDLGFPIGLEADIAGFIDQTRVRLQCGDGMVLYTDGITEAENLAGLHYGLERLCEVVRQNWDQSAKLIKEAVIADVHGFMGQQKVYDDITLLVIKQK